jgi:hypothetical protein
MNLVAHRGTDGHAGRRRGPFLTAGGATRRERRAPVFRAGSEPLVASSRAAVPCRMASFRTPASDGVSAGVNVSGFAVRLSPDP